MSLYSLPQQNVWTLLWRRRETASGETRGEILSSRYFVSCWYPSVKIRLNKIEVENSLYQNLRQCSLCVNWERWVILLYWSIKLYGCASLLAFQALLDRNESFGIIIQVLYKRPRCSMLCVKNHPERKEASRVMVIQSFGNTHQTKVLTSNKIERFEIYRKN